MSIEDFINAKKDFLTGCLTKESLAPLCVRLAGEYIEKKKPFSILLIDLDHFKSFNDKYGHLQGDEVLKYFASSLRLSFTEVVPVVFRYGGDEFVVVFQGKNSTEAYSLAVQLSKNIRNRPFLLKGKGRLFKMSFSGGIASYPADGRTMEDLIDNADKAMYSAKRRGHHGKVTQYSKISKAKIKRLPILIAILVIWLASFIIYNNKKAFFRKEFKKLKLEKINVFFLKREIAKLQNKIKTDPKITSISEPKRKIIPAVDTIYLKSGGVFRGVIYYEDENDIGIKLQLESGEGSMKINKSEIIKIHKGNH